MCLKKIGLQTQNMLINSMFNDQQNLGDLMWPLLEHENLHKI